MKRKKIKVAVMSLLIVTLMIVASFAATSISFLNEQIDMDAEFNNESGVGTTCNTDCDGYLIVNKTIWNPDTSEWVDKIEAKIGDTVRFNITITYLNNSAAGFLARDIKVNDTLPPCLAYDDGVVIEYGDMVFGGDSGTSGQHIFWNLTDDYFIAEYNEGLKLWQCIWFPDRPNSVSIFFDANVVDYTGQVGENNEVTVRAIESCCGYPIDGYDDATVVVKELPPGINVDKKVSLNNVNWYDEVTANVGDFVYFKINVSSTGSVPLSGVNVTDNLPSFLEYRYDGNPTPNVESDHYLEWFFPSIAVGSYEILTFTANVTEVGSGDNVANASACGGSPSDEDDATVNAESSEGMVVEKKVWNETSCVGYWAESITASVGDTVRFNITISHYGSKVLFDINVTDILPPCLEYANGADPLESGVSGKKIYWNLTEDYGIYLYPGESTSIEFDATVISCGENINVVNVTARECTDTIMYDEDTAIVYVDLEECEPGINVDKKVSLNNVDWSNEVNADVGDFVYFKINVSNTGDDPLSGVLVTDNLPSFLEYRYDGNPTPDVESDHYLEWFFPSIAVDSYEILTFTAKVTEYGSGDNVANASACGGSPSDEDNATVNATEPGPEMDVEKKVWNRISGHWEKSITASIGETVRFNITVTYHGSELFNLYNIWILDTLPTCLEYANNAIPPETQICSDGGILWHVEAHLENGESTYVEFDAIVVSTGENVNVVNVTANHCSGITMQGESTATVFAVGESLEAHANPSYSEIEVGDSVSFTGSASGGATPYTWDWDFGDGTSHSSLQNPTHQFNTIGNFIVNLTVTDNVGNNVTDTVNVKVNEETNARPNQPGEPSGVTNGKKGVEYSYSTSATDPDGDQLSYQWDWGDDTTSEWLGPYNSGLTVSASHTWEERGSYAIKVRAKDPDGLISDWSDLLPISMPYNRNSNSLFIQILEKLMGRFPLLEYFLSLPVLDDLLSL